MLQSIWVLQNGSMTICKPGSGLLRWPQLLRRDRAPWQRFVNRVVGGDTTSPKGQPIEGCSALWNVRQKVKLLAGSRFSTVRFYSKDWTQKPEGQPHGPTEMPDVERTSSSPLLDEEVERAAVPNSGEERRASFHDQLKLCHSPVDVLDLVGRGGLTWRRVSNSLTRVWETSKGMSEEQKRCELRLAFEHPAFQELCQCAMRDSPRMRSDDLAYSLLAVVKLGLSQRSRLVQTLLRVAQENLNEFDERALSVLASCLEDMESCKNVDALKAGLRLLVEIRIPKIQSVVALQSLMRCIGKDAPVTLKRKLANKALSMAKQFTLPNTQYMFITLATMELPFKPLLDVCSSKIAENIHGIPFSRLINVLKACRDLHYRDLLLLSAMADYVASTFAIWSNKQVILYLLMFEELGYRPAVLMDVFAERVIQNPDALTLKDVLSVLKTFSLLNHVPQRREHEFLGSLTALLESHLPKMSPSELLRSAFSLCLLGHFPPAPFEKLLREEVLNGLLFADGKFLKVNERKLHYVELCLRLDRPSLPQTMGLPPGTVLPPSNPLLANIGLVKALQSIVGTSAVKESVLLENGYFIDCVITLPQHWTELSAPLDAESLSPEQCHRVAVLCTPPSSFCMGSSHPRGRLAMKVRHLKALGYSPVLFPEHELDSLSEEERRVALRNLILAARKEERPPSDDQKQVKFRAEAEP